MEKINLKSKTVKYVLLTLLFKILTGIVVIFTKEPLIIVPLLSLYSLVSLYAIYLLFLERKQLGALLTVMYIVAIIFLLGREIYAYVIDLYLFI